MRTSDYLEGKGTVTLVSPLYRYENVSCVQFYYSMQATIKDAWTALSLTVRGGTAPQTVWRMRGVGDGAWHFGQATIVEADLSQLVFELNGDGVRAAIDDIRVIDGDCSMDLSE